MWWKYWDFVCFLNFSPKVFKMEQPNYAKQLLMQLNQQRSKGYLCDVIIVVENALFRAHKNILAARSSYFKSLVLHDNLINLDTEMVKPSVFRQVSDKMLCLSKSGNTTKEQYALIHQNSKKYSSMQISAQSKAEKRGFHAFSLGEEGKEENPLVIFYHHLLLNAHLSDKCSAVQCTIFHSDIWGPKVKHLLQ